MLDITDATSTHVINTTESIATDFAPETIESPNELGESITNLWSAHMSAKNTVRATNSELRAIRVALGEQLSEMKKLLAQPGRSGQWSGFLREHNIPRASADRLAARHQRSLIPEANRLSEPVSEPTNEEVQKLFVALWPRLQRTLRSQRSLDLFVRLVVSQFECRGLENPESLVVTAPAAMFVPPPSDGDFAVEQELESALPLVPDQDLV
jgi:hypothetical protein